MTIAFTLTPLLSASKTDFNNEPKGGETGFQCRSEGWWVLESNLLNLYNFKNRYLLNVEFLSLFDCFPKFLKIFSLIPNNSKEMALKFTFTCYNFLIGNAISHFTSGRELKGGEWFYGRRVNQTL